MLAPTWPRQRECAAFYGKPGTGHTMLDLPYPMRIAWDPHVAIRRITIHRKCAASARRVFERTHTHYGMEKIRDLGLDLFGGCYNNRPMRGGTALSMHAYACAIDFDPARNLLKWNCTKARLARPDAARFWEFWEEEGWVSLGRTRDFDWMHVQAARSSETASSFETPAFRRAPQDEAEKMRPHPEERPQGASRRVRSPIPRSWRDS